MSLEEERGCAHPDARPDSGPEVIGEAPSDAEPAPTNGHGPTARTEVFARPAPGPGPVTWPQPAQAGSPAGGSPVGGPVDRTQPLTQPMPAGPVVGPAAPPSGPPPVGPPSVGTPSVGTPLAGPPPAGLGAAPLAGAADNVPGAAPAADAADPWGQPTGDPWFDVTPGSPKVEAVGSPPESRGRRVGGAVGLLAAGAVVGALLTGAWTHWGSDDASALTSQGSPQGQPSGQVGQGQAGQGQASQGGHNQGQGQPGVGPNGSGLSGGGQGFAGRSDEVRFVGQLSGVSGSKVIVVSASGSGTYTVSSSTRIMRDGVQAKASDLRVGDVVLVHAFPAPSGGDAVLELIYARSLSGGSGSGSGGASDDGSQDGSDNGSTT